MWKFILFTVFIGIPTAALPALADIHPCDSQEAATEEITKVVATQDVRGAPSYKLTVKVRHPQYSTTEETIEISRSQGDEVAKTLGLSSFPAITGRNERKFSGIFCRPNMDFEMYQHRLRKAGPTPIRSVEFTVIGKQISAQIERDLSKGQCPDLSRFDSVTQGWWIKDNTAFIQNTVKDLGGMPYVSLEEAQKIKDGRAAPWGPSPRAFQLNGNSGILRLALVYGGTAGTYLNCQVINPVRTGNSMKKGEAGSL